MRTPDNTVIQAVREAFDQLPDTFHSVELVQFTYGILRRKAKYRHPLDSTILRELRDIRKQDSDKYGWECISRKESLYRKIR